MRVAPAAGLVAALASAVVAVQPAPTPFKLGTFEREGRTFVGIVLGEAVVIGSARNSPILLKAAGDAWRAPYAGVGPLTNPVVAASAQ